MASFGAGGGFSFGGSQPDRPVYSFDAPAAAPAPSLFRAPAPAPPPPDTRKAAFNCLVNHQLYSDICFKVEDQTIYGHKAILAAHSKYFATMFGANMSETTRIVPVPIEDVSYNTFLQLLQYIYTGDVNCASDDEYHNLFVASDKYQLDGLKELCEKYLRTNITSDNAVALLLLAHHYNSTELKRFTLNFIMTSWIRHGIIFTENNRLALEGEPALLMDVIMYAQEHYNLPAPANLFRSNFP